jgi:hypothetical protein
MQFELVVKRGTETLATVSGSELDLHPEDQDVKDVIKVEQYLERLFGLRFHINSLK